MQHRTGGVVAERHVIEANGSSTGTKCACVRRLGDVGLGGQHFGDASGRGRRFRPLRQELGSDGHRGDQDCEVLEKREQGTRRDLAGGAQISAEPHHHDERATRARDQRRLKRRAGPGQPDSGVARAAREIGAVLLELVLEPVALHHANALHLLLDELRPHAEPFLNAQRRRVQRRGAPQRDHDADRHDNRDDTGEQRLDEHEHDDAEHEQGARLDSPRQRIEHLFDRSDVGRRASHELSGAHAVVERERQALEVVVEPAPQIVRHVGRAFGGLILAKRTGTGAQHAEREQQDDVAAQAVAVVVRDHRVDDDPRDERSDEHHGGIEARAGEGEEQVTAPNAHRLDNQPEAGAAALGGGRRAHGVPFVGGRTYPTTRAGPGDFPTPRPLRVPARLRYLG